MNITQHNYEEFFMLYADNELTPEQRREVEMFLEANPDLKPEFELFCSLKLQKDPSLTLGDKSFLYRKASAVPQAVQAHMLLHLDGELPEAEAALLEARINGDQSLREEWEILNRTKLRPEQDIRFPDRQLLYRHTESGARVWQLAWVRYAAAAVLVLASGLLWLNNPEQRDPQPGSAILAAADSGIRQQRSSELKESDSETTGNINDALLATKPTAPQGGGEKTQINRLAAPEEGSKRQDMRKVAEQQTVRLQENNETKAPALAVVAEQTPVETFAETPQPSTRVIADASSIVPGLPDRAVKMEDVKKDYATQALVTQAQGQHEVPDNMFQEKDRERKGFRGMVRKANRIFNKVTNPNLDRTVVKVANVEIVLGK